MMFGFKKRHAEIMQAIKINTKIFEEILMKLHDIDDAQSPIEDLTRELNESVTDNAKKLNTMINELKGAVAMSRASLKEKVEKKKVGRPKKHVG
jgi:hypothetical protein